MRTGTTGTVAVKKNLIFYSAVVVKYIAKGIGNREGRFITKMQQQKDHDDTIESFISSESRNAIQSLSQKWEERVDIVRRHFEHKGYRVHSGLQFGCELVLYADDPAKVHSDFCVHVVPEGTDNPAFYLAIQFQMGCSSRGRTTLLTHNLCEFTIRSR